MRYAAFLRAINVGKHNRIAMVALRELFQQAGFEGISTYLQTGNVLFEFAGSEAEAVAAIDTALAGNGLRNAAASVRTASELAELVASEPFAGTTVEPKDRFVTLFQSPIPPDVAKALRTFPDVVCVRERELMVTRPAVAPPRDRDANMYLAKAMKLQGTARYWHVVEAVARLANERSVAPE